MRQFAIVTAFAAALSSAPVGAQDPTDALRRLDAEWARSYAENDTATAIKLFDDRIVVTGGIGTVKDKNGELADVRPTAGLQMHYFRTSNVDVRVHGPSAAATGAYWRLSSRLSRPSHKRSPDDASRTDGA